MDSNWINNFRKWQIPWTSENLTKLTRISSENSFVVPEHFNEFYETLRSKVDSSSLMLQHGRGIEVHHIFCLQHQILIHSYYFRSPVWVSSIGRVMDASPMGPGLFESQCEDDHMVFSNHEWLVSLSTSKKVWQNNWNRTTVFRCYHHNYVAYQRSLFHKRDSALQIGVTIIQDFIPKLFKLWASSTGP